MKKYLGIFTIALSTITFAAYSQADEKKEELEKAKQSDRARSTQGIRTDNELKDDRGDVQSNQYRKSESDSVSNQGTPQDGEDLVLEKNQDQGLSSDDDGNGLTNNNNTTQSGESRTDTPAVIQSTTSESGSPAILSGDDGTKRDGTNNVQRAKPNIAGAKEPGNMNLPAKNTAEKNKKSDAPRVRKQEEQPSQSSNTASQQSDANAVKPRQRTVNSDSTTYQQETAEPMTAKEQRKAKRKARRNNRKD